MPALDVALMSCLRLPEPDADEALLEGTLRRRGLAVATVPWDGSPVDAGVVVIRSTWNYIHHLDAFLAWADAVGGRLRNPPAVVRWNTHKRYLLELAAAGLPTVPTALVPRGDVRRLSDVLRDEQWTDVVVKPAVSAGSFATRRFPTDVDEEAEGWFADLVAGRDVLVQPYQASVDGWGERAIVAIDGVVSHAVRKSPRFFDGEESVTAVDVAEDERKLAEDVLSFATSRFGAETRGRLLYGRVDVARDPEGRPRVMELELVEPSLFLRQHPPAAEALADAIAALVATASGSETATSGQETS